MIVSHGIDSSMVHRRQCSFWESSRFDCSEAACRIRPFGVESTHWRSMDAPKLRVSGVEPLTRAAVVHWLVATQTRRW
jgi:hypothetical protein